MSSDAFEADTAPANDVQALIQAGGQGSRLGLGPKAFLVLDGRTLLERAVAAMRAVASQVTVAVPAADVARAQRLLGESAQVIAGGPQRSDTLRALIGAAGAPWLLLHDVVHPFVGAVLSRRVLGEARRSGAAVAGLTNTEFMFGPDGQVKAAPGELFTMQKPVACRRVDLLRGLQAQAGAGAARDPSVLQILALAGQPVSFVAGHPANHKLTHEDDWAFVQWLARGAGESEGAP